MNLNLDMRQLPIFLSLLLFMCFSIQLSALPYAPNPVGTNTETVKERKQRLKLEKKMDRKINKKIRQQERKQKRINRLFKKVQKKWSKRFGKKKFFGGVTNERNFRIGLIGVVAGLAAILVGSILSLGILNWIGGLTALVGVGFIIWSLIEYGS